MRARVLVRLKPEVADPQGDAIADELSRLGFEGVESVRQGKLFELEIDADDVASAHPMVAELSRKLLDDPDSEDFRITVTYGPEGSPGKDRRTGERRTGERRSHERRSAEDRRTTASHAGPDGEERRAGRERRLQVERRREDRRIQSARRSATDRRDGCDRRTGRDRRSDQADGFGGEERRGPERRRFERRGSGE